MAGIISGTPKMRAVRNALGRLKLQFLFRFFFFVIGLFPFLTAFFTWKFFFLIPAFLIGDIPAAILSLKPDFLLWVLDSRTAYRCIGYSGAIEEGPVRRFFTPPYEGKRKYFVRGLLLFFGWFLNLCAMIRALVDFSDIFSRIPRKRGEFTKRFCEGLGTTMVLAVLLCALIGTTAGCTGNLMNSHHADPYAFRGGLEYAQVEETLDRIGTIMRTEDYFYQVHIPFSENGICADGKNDAAFLATVSHTNGTQECWEFVLTPAEDWSEDIVLPIRFDADSKTETVYVSRADDTTVCYRDGSGTFVKKSGADIPAEYRPLLGYLLLEDDTLAMLHDAEAVAADLTAGFTHLRYRRDGAVLKLGAKLDNRNLLLPYEVIQELPGEPAFRTDAILFTGTHSFAMPL